MKSEFSRSRIYQIDVMNAASEATDAVRLGELTTLLAGKSGVGHTHLAAEVTDFGAAVNAQVWDYAADSDSVEWLNAAGLQARVRLKANGGLASGTGGLELDFGTGENQAARGNHGHAQLHDALSLASGTSIDWALSGQQLGGEVRVKAMGGVLRGAQGLELDFGTGVNQAARGNHGHAQLHDAVTIGNTNSVALSFETGTSQGLRAAVRRKTSGLTSGLQGLVEETSDGVVVKLGTGGTEAAAGNHGHSNATQSAAGFMSVEDKVKLDGFSSLLDIEQSVPFVRHDVAHPTGAYVGGRRRWGLAMQVLNMHFTSTAPVGTNCILGLEIDGSVVKQITIPSGPPETEVSAFLNLSGDNVHVAADKYVRMKLVSGTELIENSPATIDAVITVRPSIVSLANVKINAGGGEVSPYAADAYYGAGGSTTSTGTAIDTSAVSGPAPQGVYQTVRYKNNDANAFAYTFTGLARGISYLVRLHFAELVWTAIGEQRMKLEVIGKTTGTLNNYDTLNETGGTRFKAVVKEFTLEPTSNGGLEVRLTPIASTGGTFNLSINGIELLPQI